MFCKAKNVSFVSLKMYGKKCTFCKAKNVQKMYERNVRFVRLKM